MEYTEPSEYDSRTTSCVSDWFEFCLRPMKRVGVEKKKVVTVITWERCSYSRRRGVDRRGVRSECAAVAFLKIDSAANTTAKIPRTPMATVNNLSAEVTVEKRNPITELKLISMIHTYYNNI